MSYIVEQKIKGNIYLYRVESYWDKDKKQSRQRRKYIGPKKDERRKVNQITAILSTINLEIFFYWITCRVSSD